MFFSKLILLTPDPISLSEEWTFIIPKEPISAITEGAAIRIDVSKYIIDKWSFEEVDSKFPNGSIKGELISDNGLIFEIENKHSAHNRDEVHLIIDSNKSVPTDVKFIKVALKSSKLIKDVKVYWRNFNN